MSTHTKYFFIALCATIVWFFIMRPFTPSNIVAFELAGSVEKAQEIISNWSSAQIEDVKTGIYLDFIFIFAYCSAFMFACRAAANYSRIQLLIKTGKQLAWIVWLAGLSDATENIALLQTLDELSQASVSIAFYFAAIKFSILLVALIVVLISLVAGVFTKEGS